MRYVMLVNAHEYLSLKSLKFELNSAHMTASAPSAHLIYLVAGLLKSLKLSDLNSNFPTSKLLLTSLLNVQLTLRQVPKTVIQYK